MYNYKIVIKRWIDGDSAVVDIDLGFCLWLRDQTLRIRGVDTPELYPRYADYTSEDGVLDEEARNMAALQFVEQTAPPGEEFMGTTFKATPDNFGRWLLDFKVGDKLISELLIENGFSH